MQILSFLPFSPRQPQAQLRAGSSNRGRALGGDGGNGSRFRRDRLRLRSTRAVNRDYGSVSSVAKLLDEYTRRQGNVGEEERLVQVHRRQIDFQKLWQILRQACDLYVGAHV